MAETETFQQRGPGGPARRTAKGSGKGPRKPRGKQAVPITAHPLFPAIVALWFSALFGLGSLAIRPGLLESVVLALHIDAVIPATAPPLGITARILLALGLGAFGAVLGVWVARRLNRPAVEEPRRSRGVKERVPNQRQRDAHPDAPARRPISAHEELGGDDLAPVTSGPPPIAGRRRALTIAEDNGPDFHELAPLPGGELQILDIGQFARAAAQPAVEPAAVPPALDLATVAPATAAVEASAIPEPVASVTAAAAFAPPEIDQRPFAMPNPSEFASVRLGPAQANGMATPLADVPEKAGPDQAVASPYDRDLPRVPEGAEVPKVASANPGAVFNMINAAPRLFERPADDEVPLSEVVIAPVVAHDIDADPETAVGADQPEVMAAPVEAPAGFNFPEGTAAERITGEALGALSNVELIERLALSLKRRRDAEPAEPAVEAVSSLAVPAPEAASRQVDLPPAEKPFAAPAAAPVAIELPEPVQPVAEPEAQPAPASLPAALRPLELTLADCEPIDDDSVYLPPRHLTMPTAPVAEAKIEQPAAEPAETGEETEDGYSSLLDLKLTPSPAPAEQRHGLVRIEEPGQAAAGFEPVVIFPGQSAPAAAPAAGVEEPPVLRRFDAPGSHGVPTQASAAGPESQLNPEETERALRAALSSLQRMSGAA